MNKIVFGNFKYDVVPSGFSVHSDVFRALIKADGIQLGEIEDVVSDAANVAHIEIKNDHVYINGNLYKEDYLTNNIKTNMKSGGICSDIIVPDGCVYVLGDNRNASIDSRKFGCIPVGKIEGKVVGRWWPVNRTGKV